MNNILNVLKVGFSVIGATLGYLFGGFDTMLRTLFFFMAADYLTGVLCAIKEKKLSSKVSYEGIGKKALILILIIVTNLLGIVIEMESLRYLIISFYLANEGISILENCARFGVPIPKKLKDVLEQLKETEEISKQSEPTSPQEEPILIPIETMEPVMKHIEQLEVVEPKEGEKYE